MHYLEVVIGGLLLCNHAARGAIIPACTKPPRRQLERSGSQISTSMMKQADSGSIHKVSDHQAQQVGIF